MKYIAHKRFKQNGICGYINIPAKTELECEEGVIIYNNNIICYENCENSHQFFARNDDGNGMDRGRLTQTIIKTLSKRDNLYQTRWDKVWNDPVCQQYRRNNDEEYWLWNHKFFNADIDVLQYIVNLVEGNM